MPSSIRYLEAIPLAEPPVAAIYRRLGYRRDATALPETQKARVDGCIAEAFALIRLRGAVRRVPLEITLPDRVALAEEDVLISGQLAAFLRTADGEGMLLAATAGEAIMEAIAADMSGGDAARGVVYDATASETVDAALDWIMDYCNVSLRRERKTLMTARYSAGYGDLALENQRIFHRLLGMERLGVRLTDTCILVPEKSVTAITGILAAR